MFGATLVNALLGRETTPIEAAHRAVHRLWGVVGPITAFEAYDVAERYARQIDSDAYCSSVASDGPVNDQGVSSGWSLQFVLPVRHGEVRYRIDCHVEAEADKVPAGIDIEELLEPASLDRSLPEPVPVPFRDSRDVVRQIGSDGPIQLATNLDGNGQVWSITHSDGQSDVQPLAA